jgi:hypothetical protein
MSGPPSHPFAPFRLGYDVNSGATIIVLANLLSTPNIPFQFQQSLPADAIANLIYATVFR